MSCVNYRKQITHFSVFHQMNFIHAFCSNFLSSNFLVRLIITTNSISTFTQPSMFFTLFSTGSIQFNSINNGNCCKAALWEYISRECKL